MEVVGGIRLGMVVGMMNGIMIGNEVEEDIGDQFEVEDRVRMRGEGGIPRRIGGDLGLGREIGKGIGVDRGRRRWFYRGRGLDRSRGLGRGLLGLSVWQRDGRGHLRLYPFNDRSRNTPKRLHRPRLLHHSLLSRYLYNQTEPLDRDPGHDHPEARTLVRDPTRALVLERSLPHPRVRVISTPRPVRVIEGRRPLPLEELAIAGVEVGRSIILIRALLDEVDMEEDKRRGIGRLGFQVEAYRAGQRGIGWALEFRWDLVLIGRGTSGSESESNVSGKGKGSNRRPNRNVSVRGPSRSSVNNVKPNVNANVSANWRDETSHRVNRSLGDGRRERPRMRPRGRLKLQGREVTADYR